MLMYIKEKIKTIQDGVPTFSDKYALSLLEQQNENQHNSTLLKLYYKKYIEKERFVDYTVIDEERMCSYNLSQGATEPITWKGKLIFKTVYDMVILQMLLWELKPKTVIEFGSGNGSSAIYIKDLMDTYNNQCTVYSFDIKNKDNPIKENCVNFLYCDCFNIETMNKLDYANLPHPWLVIEDVHVNTLGILSFINQYTINGDYFYIEDMNTEKKIAINMINNGQFKLDRKYLDYFGTNSTSAKNGIFKKWKDNN